MLYSAIRYVENTNHSNTPFSILVKIGWTGKHNKYWINTWNLEDLHSLGCNIVPFGWWSEGTQFFIFWDVKLCNVVSVQKELSAFIFWDVAMYNVVGVKEGTSAFIFWDVAMCIVVSVQKELLPSSSGMWQCTMWLVFRRKYCLYLLGCSNVQCG